MIGFRKPFSKLLIGSLKSLKKREVRLKSSFSGTNSGPLLRHDHPSHGITVLTLNRPQQRNALSLELLETLSAELDDIKVHQKELRTVVICANGPVFSSGHDLKQMLSPQHSNENSYSQLFKLCSQVMVKLQEIPQPVIAAVDGVATAAGCQLVATCDLAVASPESRFATPGVNIGLFCSTPAVALARVVNRKTAMDMLLTGRMVEASEAHRIGLISHIDEHPQQKAMQLAKDIAQRSSIAINIGKQAFYEQVGATTIQEAYECASDAMVKGMLTADAHEGISAFLSKRDPEWKQE